MAGGDRRSGRTEAHAALILGILADHDIAIAEVQAKLEEHKLSCLCINQSDAQWPRTLHMRGRDECAPFPSVALRS